MTLNESNITAETYHEYNGTYYVKLSFLDYGMFIAGIRVGPSPKYEGWMVTMPSYHSKSSGWKQYIEFANNSELKAMIWQKCIEAAETANSAAPKDIVVEPTDDELNNPGTLLNDIPF